jgi:hypothetical protein
MSRPGRALSFHTTRRSATRRRLRRTRAKFTRSVDVRRPAALRLSDRSKHKNGERPVKGVLP